jgi:tellurite methyltransferase
MSTPQRAMWDERHRGATPGDPEPSVLEMLPLMPHGIALDVAAGTGRNALPLARTGIKVVTADFSETAMRSISERARRERLSIAPVVADLEETFPFRPESFDVILNVTFLHRELVPKLKSALRRGGVLLFDTFLIDQAASGHPRDPRFLLKHYELRELLADMELLRYREGIVTYPGDKHAWRAVVLSRRRD